MDMEKLRLHGAYRQKTAYKTFRAIVETTKTNEGLSSDELAEKLALSRGIMVHHLNKMIKSDLVIRHESKNSCKLERVFDLFEFYWFSTRLLFLLDFGDCDL